MLTGVALVFFVLYEIWMWQEVFGVRSEAMRDMKRRVRTIFAAQVVLTLSFFAGAALLVQRGTFLPVVVVTTSIGMAGCAFALSTGVQKRHLEVAGTKPDRSTS
jgi:hypothetical protein